MGMKAPDEPVRSRAGMRMPRNPGYIGSLCLALLHRWDPERVFVIVTAHIDENGTDGSETMLLSAHIAEMRQWYQFEQRAGALFREHGVRIFHAKEFHDSDGDFAGWKVDKKIDFLDDFGHIANETLAAGVTSLIKMSEYKEVYACPPKPKKLRLDTAYGLCFRETLQLLCDMVLKGQWDAKWGDNPRTLHVVIEDEAKNVGDAIRVFREFKADLLPQYVGLLGTITLDTKENCLPLSISDLMAHSTRRWKEKVPPKWTPKKKLKMQGGYRQNHYRNHIHKGALIAHKAEIMRRDTEAGE